MAPLFGRKSQCEGCTGKRHLGAKGTFGANAARKTGGFRGVSAPFSEHFELRADSGEGEAQIAERGHPLQEGRDEEQGGERKDGRQTEGHEEDPDFKWAVEWLVKRRGQRRAASLLGVDRKTVARALRRKRLTARMNHAVQTLMARVDDPEAQEAMPLDRMESQIRFLLESMGELEDLLEGLTLRVQALEEAQSWAEAEAEAPRVGEAESEGRDDAPDKEPQLEPEPDRTERRFGWGRRQVG